MKRASPAQQEQGIYRQIWRWRQFGSIGDPDATRQRPLKAPASYPVAHDHCPSRVVNREVVFGPQEYEHLVRMLRGDRRSR